MFYERLKAQVQRTKPPARGKITTLTAKKMTGYPFEHASITLPLSQLLQRAYPSTRNKHLEIKITRHSPITAHIRAWRLRGGKRVGDPEVYEVRVLSWAKDWRPSGKRK